MANGLLHDLTVNYLLLLSLIYSSIPFWPHKLETLVLFTFSFCLLVYCFVSVVVVVLVVMRVLVVSTHHLQNKMLFTQQPRSPNNWNPP